MKTLITGTAGFIGFHLANRLIARGDQVVGLDIINDYYDVNIKYDRLAYAGIQKEDIAYGQAAQSQQHDNYRFVQLKLEDREGLQQLFAAEQFDTVVNLAAQAGVRYSLENPYAYVDSNLVGFVNILECCRHHEVGHLAFASSSSVYGLNEKMPLSTHDNVDHPISLYAATKKSNELMPIPTATCSAYPRPACASSPSTAPEDAPTWPSSSLPKPFSRTSPSRCSTTAICCVISPISTISWKASFAW